MVTSGADIAETATGDDAVQQKLAAMLLEGVEELARAGQVEAACRLAGRACVSLRRVDPQLARRFDVFLHRQTRHLSW